MRDDGLRADRTIRLNRPMPGRASPRLRANPSDRPLPGHLKPIRLLGVALGAGLLSLAATPASAQSFFEKLFGLGSSQQAPAAAQPAEAPPAAAAPAPTGWPARLALLPPKRPAVTVAAEPAPQPATQALAAVVPAAPQAAAPAAPRGPAPAQVPPAQVSPAQAAPARPIVTAAAPAIPMAPPEPLSSQAIVERANAYFSNLNTLVADFTQIGGDGRRLGGTLYLQRPGKLRFDYEAPATLQIVADGSSVAVRDRKLATQDLYSINQTPLKFLLRDRVNLGQDIRIIGVANDGAGARIDLEDRSTLGGTSKIMLYFDPRIETLQQWRIVDAQGFQTTVMLNKTERSVRLDQAMFQIDYTPTINSNNNR